MSQIIVCLPLGRSALQSDQADYGKVFRGQRAEEESAGEFRRCCGVNLTLGGFLLSRREGKSFTPALTRPQRY